MTKIGKKLASVFLAVAMVVTFVPVLGLQTVYAEDGEYPIMPLIYDSFNTGSVSWGPSVKRTFTVEQKCTVVSITNYHYGYDVLGHPGPGTISIKEGDTVIASAAALATDPEGYYWTAFVNAQLEPGKTYTVIDSENVSWCYNSASDGAGFTRLNSTASIHLDANGGTLNSDSTLDAILGAPIAELLPERTLPEPSRDNYVFQGWYTASSDGTKVDPVSDIVTSGDYYLFAHWAAPAHDHSDITFEPCTSTASLPTASGNYYLTNDVELSGAWTVPAGTTNLCLNGHGVKANCTDGSTFVVIEVDGGATLNLYDCGTTEHKYTVDDDLAMVNDDATGDVKTFTGGYITGGCGSYGGGIYINGGTVNMYGGTIIGNPSEGSGGGVYIGTNGTFTMYDGNIIGNSADTGGGVYVGEGRSFTMSGGNISNNTSRSGGGVRVEGYGTFRLKGGEISGNTSTDSGGGVNLSVGGQFYQSGGSITGNTAQDRGGGVNAYNESTFTMSGGSIAGNTAKYGGGVCTGESTTFNMSQNVSITSNTAQEKGGGVYVPYGTFNLSGAPAVTGNKQGSGTDEKDSNVWLKNNKKVTITGSLMDGASIGVTMQTPGTFTSRWSDKMGEADPALYFTSDDTGFVVSRTSAGEGELKVPASIDAIEISNLSLPQEGAAPDTASFTTNAEAAGYKIEFANWIDRDANKVVNPEDTFKGGTNYAFDIKLSPLTSGYVFPEDKYSVSVTVNGKSYTCDDGSYEPGTALWWYGNEREWLRLRVYYKVPEKVTVPTGKDLTYDGKAQTGVAAGTGYTLSGTTSATSAGSYEATASLKYKEFDTWSDGTTTDKKISWKINKAANPLTMKAKTATVKYKKLKKKTQTLAVTKVIKFTKDAKDKKTYTLSSAKKGKKSFKKYFKINKSTGKVTVKKGLKKGTYKVKVKVKAAGNANYKASAVKTVTFKVKIK